MLILTPLNMGGNEIQNMVVQVLAAAPAPAKQGQIYYNSTDNLMYQYTGSAWAAVGTPYVLPQATATVLGGIKIGSGLKLANGTTQVDWDRIPNKPNTVDGYGIVDAVTEEQLGQAIGALGTLFHLVGVVNTKDDLPGTGNKIGDVYIVKDGTEYVWVKDSSNQEYWEEFGVAIDLTGYLKTEDLKQGTGTSTTAPMSQDATSKALAAQKVARTIRTLDYDPVTPDRDQSVTVTVAGYILCVEVYDDKKREKVLCDLTYSADHKSVTVTAAAGSMGADDTFSVLVTHFAQ